MKGIYLLKIQVNKEIEQEIGALGNLAFTVGTYVYVGSAQSNLELRVTRHMRKEKCLFWHIDYLLNSEAAKLTGVYYKAGQKQEECQTPALIEQSGGEPIAGFGCSDCHCSSHLFFVKSFQFLESQMRRIH